MFVFVEDVVVASVCTCCRPHVSNKLRHVETKRVRDVVVCVCVCVRCVCACPTYHNTRYFKKQTQQTTKTMISACVLSQYFLTERLTQLYKIANSCASLLLSFTAATTTQISSALCVTVCVCVVVLRCGVCARPTARVTTNGCCCITQKES